MKRAERRKVWLDSRRGGSLEPFVRLPGSLKPFHRIQGLTAALVAANKHFDALLAVRSGFLEKIVGRPERTPEQVVAIGDAQEAVIQAREALVGYRSRGHGKQRRFA